MEENKIVIYQTEDGQTQIDVRLEQDMIWLTRQQLADSVVVAKFANTTQHGAIEGKTQTHEKDYFNLYDSGTCPHGYRIPTATHVVNILSSNRSETASIGAVSFNFLLFFVHFP